MTTTAVRYGPTNRAGNLPRRFAVLPSVRLCAWSLLLVASTASADEGSIRVRQLTEPSTEPLLHLDATLLDPANAEGGISDGRALAVDLGSLRFATAGSWWRTGQAPSPFVIDLRDRGWRAAAELSYELGPFRVGANASSIRTVDSSRQTVGLFVHRTFHVSRWVRPWITLGLGWERGQLDGEPRPRQGPTIGISVGTTFR
ncbi:MAG: hypothetical protein KF773_16185 [Deltaproteobacteria bacterium]|nr:hypothetical protein [Deltaproteobacteria bacterium]